MNILRQAAGERRHANPAEGGRGAEALARINGTVRACIAATANNPDLSAFLAQVLSSAVEHLDAMGGGVWLVDEQDFAHLVAEHDGARVSILAQTDRQVRLGMPGGHILTLKDDIRANRIVYERAEPFEASADAEEAQYARDLTARGLACVAIVPIFIGDRFQGALSLLFRERRELTAEEEELAYALANHTALAIHTRQLADSARDSALARERAAIAKEREEAERRRADSLARVNASLYSMLDRFADQQDLRTFLGEAVCVCAREFDAVSAGIWRRLEAGDHVLVISFEDGGVRSPAETAYPIRFTTAPEDEPPFARGEILVFAGEALRAQPWSSAAQRFAFEARGITALASVPMFVGDRCVGTISLRYALQRPDFTGERRELALALANQIALALEFSRLGDEAQQAALAQAQARAAQERAEAIARIGRAERASLDHLSRDPNPDVFLGQILTVAARDLCAAGAGLWVDEGGVEHLLLSLENGEVHRADSALHPGLFAYATLLSGPALSIAKSRFGRQGRGVIGTQTYDDIRDDPELAAYRAYMEAYGLRTVFNVPIFLGEQYRGAMTLRFQEDRRLNPDEQELAHALANQAVLALELQRLSRAAREAAVLEERNRIAREIHDTLAQGFAAVRLHLELARGETGLPPHTVKALELAYQIAGENLVETRRSMAVLKATEPGLVTSLSAVVEGVRRLGQAKVVAALSTAPRPPNDVAHELFRIAQEAMLNAARHAEAQTITVTLTPHLSDGVRLAIVDDGKGFDPSSATPGFGLIGQRERAAAISADLSIASAPGLGAEVVVTWAP